MSKSTRYLSRSQIRERYGISSMTLWRWERDPHLNFPKPIEINGRLYRDEGALESWDRDRAVAVGRRAAR
jgi:predicted DNA-binding transcriptional regulator AlpA